MPVASSVMMLGGQVLPGQHDRLGLGCGGGAGGHVGRTAHVAVAQPASQASLSEAADPVRGGIAGEQYQRSFVRGVVEGPLQAGKHTGHQVAQPVDHAHPVGDQIRSMPGQHREFAHEVGTGVDDR